MVFCFDTLILVSYSRLLHLKIPLHQRALLYPILMKPAHKVLTALHLLKEHLVTLSFHGDWRETTLPLLLIYK